MARKNRAVALLLAAAVLLVIIFSFFIIAAEAHHDCQGDDCPICELVVMCENNIRIISAIFVFIALVAALTRARRSVRAEKMQSISLKTPITLKVKLSN